MTDVLSNSKLLNLNYSLKVLHQIPKRKTNIYYCIVVHILNNQTGPKKFSKTESYHGRSYREARVRTAHPRKNPALLAKSRMVTHLKLHMLATIINLKKFSFFPCVISLDLIFICKEIFHFYKPQRSIYVSCHLPRNFLISINCQLPNEQHL